MVDTDFHLAVEEFAHPAQELTPVVKQEAALEIPFAAPVDVTHEVGLDVPTTAFIERMPAREVAHEATDVSRIHERP